MFVRSALLVCLSLSAVPALAQDAATPGAAPTASTPAAKPVKVRKICRQDTDTGSIATTTTCHTADEWKQIDGTNQSQGTRALDQLHRGAGMGVSR
jgi:hypothetical protein